MSASTLREQHGFVLAPTVGTKVAPPTVETKAATPTDAVTTSCDSSAHKVVAIGHVIQSLQQRMNSAMKRAIAETPTDDRDRLHRVVPLETQLHWLCRHGLDPSEFFVLSTKRSGELASVDDDDAAAAGFPRWQVPRGGWAVDICCSCFDRIPPELHGDAVASTIDDSGVMRRELRRSRRFWRGLELVIASKVPCKTRARPNEKSSPPLRRDYRMPSDMCESSLEIVATLAVDDSFFPAFRPSAAAAAAASGSPMKAHTRRDIFWYALRFAMRTRLPLCTTSVRYGDALDVDGRLVGFPRRSAYRDVYPAADATAEEIMVANSLDVDDEFFAAFSCDSSPSSSSSSASFAHSSSSSSS